MVKQMQIKTFMLMIKLSTTSQRQQMLYVSSIYPKSKIDALFRTLHCQKNHPDIFLLEIKCLFDHENVFFFNENERKNSTFRPCTFFTFLIKSSYLQFS